MSEKTISESSKLAKLKDKFIRFWPSPAQIVIDLEENYLSKEDNILVVGSGRISKVTFDKIINTDIREFAGVDVVSDGQKLSFKDNSFDAVVCHQVLEHVPNADMAISEMYRVLKPGGKVIITVPFFFPFHASPYDFRRWTIPGLQQSFKKFDEAGSGIFIGPVSGFLCTIQHFFGLLVPNFYLSYFVKGIIGYALFPFKYLDIWASKLPNASYMALSVYYVGVKPA